MSVLTKARRLFARRPQLSEHTVAHSKVEEAVFGDWRKRAPALAEAVDNPPLVKSVVNEGEDTKLDPRVWGRLAEDVFFEFFGRSEPEILDEHQIDSRYHVNRGLTDKQSREESFLKQHPRTRGEGFESSLGTLAALDSLAKSYEDELREHGQRQNEIAQERDEIDRLDQKMAELREQRDEAPDGDDAQHREMREGGAKTVETIDREMRELGRCKRLAKAALAAQEAAQAAAAVQMGAATRQAVQKAAKAASEAIEVGASMVGVGPGREPGQRVRLDPGTMFDLAERYAQSPVLRAVAQMMGRLELSMGTKRRQMRKGGSEEMVDVELGRDLAFVLPQEKVLMRHPLGRLDFFRRYQEEALMQFEMWSEQELKRGPVIVLVDESQSMEGARIIWAKATALALAATANRERRHAAIVAFGSETEQAAWYFLREHALDPMTAAECAEHFFKGGTDITTALAFAAGLQRQAAPFHAADIVIVTDGNDTISDEAVALRDELVGMGVRLHGIQIGTQIAGLDYLGTACETVTLIQDIDLGGPNAATDALAVNLT